MCHFKGKLQGDIASLGTRTEPGERGDRERALHHPAALAGESWVGELLQFDGGLLVPRKASSL